MLCLVLHLEKQSRALEKPLVLGMAIGCKLPFLRSGSASLPLQSDLLCGASILLTRTTATPGTLSRGIKGAGVS